MPRLLGAAGSTVAIVEELESTAVPLGARSVLLRILTRKKDPMTEDSYVFQSSRGNQVGGQWYTNQFNKALKQAGITDYVRPFHDMRHTAITNMAATGKINNVALMGIAGHRSPGTTRRYMQLAGVVFHDEANALEERLNGGAKEAVEA